MSVPLYDDFDEYDRFVRWQQRLAHEVPFLERHLSEIDATSVLDVACGTGQHAIALSKKGYEVVGADPSTGMIQRARQNAIDAAAEVSFVDAGFGQLTKEVGEEFDALFCLGNSLPHVAGPETLRSTLNDFAGVVRSGGLILIQLRNFDHILARQERWMSPQSRQEGDNEWLFLRFYDFGSDGRLSFNVVTLHRQAEGAWQQQVRSTTLYPIRQAELIAGLVEAGFTRVACWGNMDGSEYVLGDSPNLIVTAHRI
jgi:SAM-dependent methyltransferase